MKLTAAQSVSDHDVYRPTYSEVDMKAHTSPVPNNFISASCQKIETQQKGL